MPQTLYSERVFSELRSANMMYARVDKLQRDAMVWTHLAGDTVQRLRVVKRLGSGGGSAGAH